MNKKEDKKSNNIKDYKIAVIWSHTALQILKWAKDEWFETICITPPKRTKMYASFWLADQMFKIKNRNDFWEIEKLLIKENAILIPHGSMVEYLWQEKIKALKCMHFWTKKVLEIESCREWQRNWLEWAWIKMPRKFDKPEDIDRTVIIKFNWAKWWHGYFIANSPWDFAVKMEKHLALNWWKKEWFTIQEYVIWVPVYAHYFYSPITKQLEIMSFDKRYESNADSIWRITAKDQLDADIESSYTIIWNIPLVVRESLLPEFWQMWMDVIKESKKIMWWKGLYWPFCLECVIDQNIKFKVFEISARIVAWTNPFINWTPYTWLRYNEPMSTWRRIAREIKNAIEKWKIEEIID